VRCCYLLGERALEQLRMLIVVISTLEILKYLLHFVELQYVIWFSLKVPLTEIIFLSVVKTIYKLK
jgi:hypothetical protein